MLDAGAAGFRDAPERDRHHRAGKREIEEERPAPRAMLDKPSAKDRTESGRNRGKSGPRANGPASGLLAAPRVVVERCADDCEAAGNQQRRPDSLNATRHHKLLDARRKTASR